MECGYSAALLVATGLGRQQQQDAMIMSSNTSRSSDVDVCSRAIETQQQL
jgi:hypothetical protein